MRVEVYKCRFTGLIFEKHERRKYINHLKELRKEMRDEREYRQISKNFWKWLHEEKLKITHVDQIVPWFLENQKTIMKAFKAGIHAKDYHSFSEKFYPDTDEFTKLTLKVGRFNKLISNSHRCPDNGTTNWCVNDPTLPKGYPGWNGRIDGVLKRLPKHNNDYPYSALVNLVGLKTGSGGGGNESWGYDVKIFLADWPGLEQQRFEEESDTMVGIIKGSI